MPSPNWGAPSPPRALPSRPKISAWLDAIGAIVPPAAATSGSARTLASSDAGTVAAPLWEPLTISLPAITASVCCVRRREDAVEGLLDRVGQDQRAADHRDADHDGERRQQRADLAPREALQRDGDHRSVISSSAARISCALERPEVADDVAVGEEQHAVGDRRGVRVVGDHHRGLAERVDRVAQQREDLAAGRSSPGCPVGSSANITLGRDTSARATATRCC